MAKGIAHREWTIHLDEFTNDLGQTDEAAFREAVQAELAMCENFGERLGVAIVAAPIRTKLVGGNRWFTVGWVFKTATVPAARDNEPQPEPLVDDLFEDEPAPDDVALVEDAA